LATVLQAQQTAEEDRLRASWYSLLARLLAAPADDGVLAVLRGLGDDDTELGAALRALKAAAEASSLGMIEQEFFDLFIGVGKGELVPYGSYYLTGFLHEKPLARLRDDMAKLGIARSEGVPESEDHIAALCDMMAGLITGAFGAPADLAIQRKFFDDHIGCWAPRFFENLEAAPSAAFYMPVGTLGRLFVAVESQAFEMAA
jgi:TorA maturation chaperone TorD